MKKNMMAKKTTMKIGFQTIVWWPFRDPLEYRLEVIAAAGYQGVELTERPDELPPIEQLLKLLEKYKLELIGLSSGSLRSRMDFCRDFRPEYLYTDEWNEEIAQLIAESEESEAGPFTLALHPHVFRPEHRLKTAEELLNQNVNLKFVPDTAHLTIVGDDPIEAIRRCKDRIAAVNIKDWTSEFGRSVHRYARGFTELGEGRIDLDRVLEALDRIHYEGRLVVEQDYTKIDPAISTFNSARWLARRGLLPEPPAKLPIRPLKVVTKSTSLATATSFLQTVASAGWQAVQPCYDSIAWAFFELCECELVMVWTCSPAHELVNLVAIAPDCDVPLKSVLNLRDTLIGDTVEEQTIQHYDLNSPTIYQRFDCPQLLNTMELKRIVSIPVFNPWNPKHVRLVVNIFHNSNMIPISDDKLGELAVAVGQSTTSALDEICSTSTGKVNMLVRENTNLVDFAKSLTLLVARLIECEEVSILLTSPTGNELELLGYVGEEWMSGGVEEWYRMREDSISRVLETKETLIMAIDSREVAEKADKEEMGAEERGASAATPLVGADGTVLGLVYCSAKRALRKLGTSESFAFSDDDCAVLEAIVQAAVPHIEVLKERGIRERMLGRLTHELKVPLVAVRGATDFMKRTKGADKFFDYDYLGDVQSWTELMGRLIDNAEAFRHSADGLQIEPTLTNLLEDVIAPAIRQVRLLLREREFSHNDIHCTKVKFQRFPSLWVDRNQFQQVIFNLLSNAIKYAGDDPNAFRVEIYGEEQPGMEFVVGSAFVIWFRDWGPGIEEEMKEAIFHEGIRGEGAVEKNVAGQGLGLWVVRQIVERHGGTIDVTNLYSPTEIRMSLPYSLRSQPPL